MGAGACAAVRNDPVNTKAARDELAAREDSLSGRNMRILTLELCKRDMVTRQQYWMSKQLCF
jgi:hypothetical protein